MHAMPPARTAPAKAFFDIFIFMANLMSPPKVNH
jgi:hypothetical protein